MIADAGGLLLESDEIRVKLDKHHVTVQELLPKVLHGLDLCVTKSCRPR